MLLLPSILPIHSLMQISPMFFTWLGRKGTDSCTVKAAGVKYRARIKDTYQIEKGNKLDHLLPYFLSIINQIHFHF